MDFWRIEVQDNCRIIQTVNVNRKEEWTMEAAKVKSLKHANGNKIYLAHYDFTGADLAYIFLY